VEFNCRSATRRRSRTRAGSKRRWRVACPTGGDRPARRASPAALAPGAALTCARRRRLPATPATGDVITGRRGLAFCMPAPGAAARAIVSSGGPGAVVPPPEPDLPAARAGRYDAVGRVHFAGAHYRTDIALARNRSGVPPRVGGRRCMRRDWSGISRVRIGPIVWRCGAGPTAVRRLASGEDLSSRAHQALFGCGRRLDQSTSVDGYVRRTLVRTFLDSKAAVIWSGRPRADRCPTRRHPVDLPRRAGHAGATGCARCRRPSAP